MIKELLRGRTQLVQPEIREVRRCLNYRILKSTFFKCALQVNPVGYILYRGQEQNLSEAEYNRQLLNEALEAGIEVIGLADHGSVDQIEELRTLFNQNGIVVFPGFEIASSEKFILCVCLMSAPQPI